MTSTKPYCQTLAQWAIPILLILLGAVARLIPHPANVAPIAAMALFGGLYLPKRWAILAPLLALFVGDLFIGFYSLPMMLAVYGSFAITGLIGLWIRRRKHFYTVVGGTLLSAVVFYLITNGAVWLFGTMYPHSVDGLLQSYTMALPFFRNSLVGDFFYVGLLVTSMELCSLATKFHLKQTTKA